MVLRSVCSRRKAFGRLDERVSQPGSISTDEITTIVSNNANFVKGKAGEPLLISWDDAVTMFHEFGHALHGLSSNVTYPTLSGTNVATDSTSNSPRSFSSIGSRRPRSCTNLPCIIKPANRSRRSSSTRSKRPRNFNQGFATTEYLSSALVDMKLHLAGDQKIDPDSSKRRRSHSSECRTSS